MVTKVDIRKETIIAEELDDRYMRIMEKMMEDGTWTDDATRMYEDFSLRWGKYLKTN